MAKNKDEPQKVFDVSKPGKTAASASSRPLIIGHKTLLQDPMVTTAPIPISEKSKPDNSDLSENETASGDPADKIKLLEPPDTVIDPPSADESKEDKVELESTDLDEEELPSEKIEVIKSSEADEPKNLDESSESSDVIEVKKIDKSDKPKEPDQPIPEDPAQGELDTESEPQNIPEEKEHEDSLPDDMGSKNSDDKKKNKDGKKLAAGTETTQEDAYKKLIDDKTYFVPIGQQKRKRSMRRLLLLIILLLIVAIGVANVLIDTGTIKTDIKPVVDLIKN